MAPVPKHYAKSPRLQKIMTPPLRVQPPRRVKKARRCDRESALKAKIEDLSAAILMDGRNLVSESSYVALVAPRGGTIEVEMPESFYSSFQTIADRKVSRTTASCIDTISKADPESPQTAHTYVRSKIYGKWTSWLESIGVGKHFRTV